MIRIHYAWYECLLPNCLLINFDNINTFQNIMLGMLKLKRVSQTWILNEENKKDINQLAQGLIIVKLKIILMFTETSCV